MLLLFLLESLWKIHVLSYLYLRLYAACLGGSSLSIMSITHFFRHVAMILRRIEINRIGRRLPRGTLVLPAFCIAFKIP